MIEILDTSLSEIQQQCLVTHKVGGFYRRHRFDLMLIHINGERRTVIDEACARFNQTDYAGTLGFWLSKAALDDYLFKLGENAAWMRAGKRADYMPYAPQILRDSCACAVNFNLENIQSTIKNQEEQMLAKFGVFPTEPTIMQLQDSRDFFRLFLRIGWQS